MSKGTVPRSPFKRRSNSLDRQVCCKYLPPRESLAGPVEIIYLAEASKRVARSGVDIRLIPLPLQRWFGMVVGETFIPGTGGLF